MANQIKVLLKNDVPSLGAGGEVVKVRPGFARNFLLPRGLAVPASAGNLARVEDIKRQVASQAKAEIEAASAAAAQLSSASVTITRAVGEEGKMYGSVTTKDIEDAFVTTALEMVLIGRHPHMSLWQWESQDDERIAREALAAVELSDFAERRTDTLSGGEQRRVAIAALLAQQPGIFLLDEPTNHLDPHHQLGVLSLFRELALAGSTVITTLHDPTLAARFADRIILLFGDGRWSAGPVREVLTAQSLSALYNSPMIEIEKDGRRVFVNG